MKVILFISTLILLTSCGKYDKPFISFQSPEKRLMDKTWSCSMAVAEDGTEFEIEDKITFTIDGTDSIFTRITTHWPLTPLYYTATPDPVVSDTIVGTWTWAYALGGNFNKQILKISYPSSIFGRNNRVSILSKKELVFIDQTYDNTTYHYSKL
jgi:hypothetical protein